MKILVSIKDGQVSYRKVTDEGKDEYLENIYESGIIKATIRKSRLIALILAIFFGVFGVHRFYLGKWKTGILYFLTFGLFCIGVLVDIIKILVGGKFLEKQPTAPVELFYELDDKYNSEYSTLLTSFRNLMNSDKIKEIVSKGKITDWKRSGGAKGSVSMSKVSLRNGFPGKIHSNFDGSFFQFSDTIIYLLPDKIVIFGYGKLLEKSYPSIDIRTKTVRFHEETRVPNDAEVVGETWKYVTRGGGPDKRFKDNRKIPICRYEYLYIELESLKKCILISKFGSGQEFGNQLLTYARNFKEG